MFQHELLENLADKVELRKGKFVIEPTVQRIVSRDDTRGFIAVLSWQTSLQKGDEVIRPICKKLTHSLCESSNFRELCSSDRTYSLDQRELLVCHCEKADESKEFI
jgi:hypothetical protein